MRALLQRAGAAAQAHRWDLLGCGLALLYGVPSVYYPFGSDQGIHWYLGHALLDGQLLYPVAPEQLAGVSLTVRLRGSAASRMNEGFARKAHQILAAVDPALRMAELQARAQADSEDALAVRLVGLALSCILVTVLLFSAAGVYALMSFTVAQRRREIGIRAALGASSIGVLRSVFSRVAVQVGLGVVLGVLGAMVIAPLSDDAVLAARLSMVTPAIALLMVLVGMVAAYGPARRSLRIQPTEAVRAE